MVDVPSVVPPDFNFSYWQQHLIDFMTMPFTRIVGFFFWPIVFSGLIAYIYVKNKSAVSAAVAILIICGGFMGSGVFMEVPGVVMFFQLIVSLAIAGLVVVFLMRRRQ